MAISGIRTRDRVGVILFLSHGRETAAANLSARPSSPSPAPIPAGSPTRDSPVRVWSKGPVLGGAIYQLPVDAFGHFWALSTPLREITVEAYNAAGNVRLVPGGPGGRDTDGAQIDGRIHAVVIG